MGENSGVIHGCFLTHGIIDCALFAGLWANMHIHYNNSLRGHAIGIEERANIWFTKGSHARTG